MTTSLAVRSMAWTRRLAPIAIFVSGIVLWELVVIVFSIEGFLLPKPSKILTTLVEEASVIFPAGWFTMKEALLGFALGTTGGVAVALGTARWTVVREGLLPFAIAVNATPIIAVAPVMNQWFTITSIWAKAATVAIIVFFPVMINVTRGLTEVDPARLELARSYAASPFEILRKIRVPNALPYFFSALKVTTTLSVIAAIVAEYFGGSRRALGVYISQQAALFQLPKAWAAVVVASLMGVGFYLAVALTERVVMPWHASVRTLDEP